MPQDNLKCCSVLFRLLQPDYIRDFESKSFGSYACRGRREDFFQLSEIMGIIHFNCEWHFHRFSVVKCVLVLSLSAELTVLGGETSNQVLHSFG